MKENVVWVGTWTHTQARGQLIEPTSPLFLWTLHTELRSASMVGILTAEPSCPRPCNLFAPEYWHYRHTSPDTQQHFAPTTDHWLFSICSNALAFWNNGSCIKDSGDYFLIFYFKETKRSWNEFWNKNKVGNGSRVFCGVGHCSAACLPHARVWTGVTHSGRLVCLLFSQAQSPFMTTAGPGTFSTQQASGLVHRARHCVFSPSKGRWTLTRNDDRTKSYRVSMA